MFEEFIFHSYKVINYANVIGHGLAADTFEDASDMVIDLVYKLMTHSDQGKTPTSSTTAT